MRSWSYTSLTGQLVLALLGALIVSQVVASLFIWRERREFLESSNRAEFFNRTQSLTRLVLSLPVELRADVVRSAATDDTRFWVASDVEPASTRWLEEMRRQFATPLGQLLSPSGKSVEVASGGSKGASANAMKDAEVTASRSPPQEWPADLPGEATTVELANDLGAGVIVPLDDGTRLHALFHNHLSGSVLSTPFPVAFALTAVLVTLVALVVIRRITKPLARLTEAAETLGRGGVADVLPETGPDDISHLAAAFNLMQERIHRFVEDRTRMLGAIGHDLRTPLTTLRLRAEFVENEELQTRMFATIDEMQVMTEAMLALARQESEAEQARTIDLDTLVGSLCDDLAAIGCVVRYAPSERVTCRCRPDSVKRALRNLIENAVRYGSEADVELVSFPDKAEVVVRDKGPGIPQDRVEEVFAPFVRLDNSRSLETGGVGLGLSIARAVARRHGGEILLRNAQGGLEAVMKLPR